MFSQRSFVPVEQLPPPRSTATDHTTPLEEEDDFDLDDPRFHTRSRASSLVGLEDQESARGETSNSPGVRALAEEVDKQPVHAPMPRHHPTLPRTTASALHRTSPKPRDNVDRNPSRGNRDMMPEEPISPPRQIRASPSPSRPSKINALSPLQAFSPLQPMTVPRDRSNTASEASSAGTRSRASSITKSLSRRQSLIAHAARWGTGEDYEDDSSMSSAGLFSRLTLVKAPNEESGLKRRSKSSSALAPFSAMAALGDNPATSNHGPRRSFAASSFAGFAPLAPMRSPSASYSPGGPDAVHRITQLYGTDNDVGIQRKTLTPEEVVEVARGLSSPVMVPEGGFKRTELKRRKSAGPANRRTQQEAAQPENPPVALEPVDYVQLDDETLLPFVDRPAEVAELLKHPSNEKMFKALRAAFPKTPARQHWQAMKPEEWNWDEFCMHLTILSRAECPDYAWVFRARQAVRQRSVALWEKVGVCLGCDGDLLNAGGEDDIPPSWGGLGLGEEGEYDPSQNQVYIAALEAMDPEERERAERELREEFGEIAEDDSESAAGMAALLGLAVIGEGDEGTRIGGRPTIPQNPAKPSRHGKSASIAQYGEIGRSPVRPSRNRSFVGLQILTAPASQPNQSPLPRSPSVVQTPALGASMPIFERGPGSPLFPSSFSSLSVEPNLGRSASVGLAGGMRVSPLEYRGADEGGRRWSAIQRKPSGAGLSESAITFSTSESEWSHTGLGGEHHHEIHA